MKHNVQAIILAAGPGSRMTTIVGQKPKCLLPIGNFPMIYYPLYLLQEAGFTEVTVVVANNHKKQIEKLLDQYLLTIKLDIAAINTTDYPGTLDSLRTINHKIKKSMTDVLIISSDIITDVNLNNILNFHGSRGAAMTMLTAKQNNAYAKTQPPGLKCKSAATGDIIGIEESNNRLLYAIDGGDYDKGISFSNTMLESCKEEFSINTSSSLFDSHLYVIKRWLIDEILSQNSQYTIMDSLKSEVIPHIISQQFANLNPDHSDKTKYEDLIKKYNTSSIETRYHPLSTLDKRVCYAFHHPGVCFRINTLNIYWRINKEMHKLFEKIKSQKYENRHPSSNINSKAQICPDSLIGRDSVIEEKTNITSSMIGNYCSVKSFVRIKNSLLFDSVTVNERCVIENSLICVSIDKPCVIKNCIVSDKSRIEADGVYSDEVLEANQDYTE